MGVQLVTSPHGVQGPNDCPWASYATDSSATKLLVLEVRRPILAKLGMMCLGRDRGR